MKRPLVLLIPFIILTSLGSVSLTVFSLSQHSANPASSGDTAVFQQANPLPQQHGGGEWLLPEDHLSDEQYAQIERQLASNLQLLDAVGLVQTAQQTAVGLDWPLQAAPHLDDFGYHGISNFVDQNANYPSQTLDFACGQRTYDTDDGYNHRGTDLFTWPFPWQRMDDDEIWVVAAAPGLIVYREDGNFDRQCAFNNDPWNAIFIRHADGTIAWYGHLKNGSLTEKTIGQTVEAGEYLGVVGSSGNSTAPHLHLEIRSSNQTLLDPFAGSCNSLNEASLWAEQPPYYDTAVNKITTGYAPPVTSACSTPELSHEATSFPPGSTIYFTTYYRDQLSNRPSQYSIYRPDGTLYQRWFHTIPDEHYAASWWWWSFAMPANVPLGRWTFEVKVNNLTYQHPFFMGSEIPPTIPTPPPVITVTSPNGGELIAPGQPLTISWQTELTNALQIDLLQFEAVYSQTITSSHAISGQGVITWQTPLTLPHSLYAVRVTDVLSPTQFDESDRPFIIGILDEWTFLPIIQRP